MGETIVVIGAGVSGLTSALLLSKDKTNDITVVAKHMPGDYDIEYASPFAGANVMPMSSKEDSKWERKTWYELKRLCQNVPEAGIHFQKCRINRRASDVEDKPGFPKGPFDPKPWFADLFEDYRELPKEDVLKGYDSACEFGSVCINTAIYLPWLVGQLTKNGVKVKRAVVSDVRQAKKMSHTGRPASLIINATGLGSMKIEGIKDSTMYPARGQVVVVRNEVHPMLLGSCAEGDVPGDALYVMQRASGGGTILGGTFQPDNWESQPDPDTSIRIMSRIVEAVPEIADGKGIAGLSVVRHGVGLRPYRKAGVRIESEKLDDETHIVHNYGHGGWGYQGSYGCAQDVVELVEKVKRERSGRAKL